jgi:hypothetical protein
VLARQPFRARFRLRGRDRAIADLRGYDGVRAHAEAFIRDRLAPAQPRNDGRQTPYRGHPVFVAQHATATCCRRCLAKWHGVAAGADLTPAEQQYVVEVILRWIGRELATPAENGPVGSSAS